MQELRIQLAQARDILEARLGRKPTIAELAARLKRPENEIIEGLVAANGYSSDSIDMPYDNGTDAQRSHSTLADVVGQCDTDMELVEDLLSLAPLLHDLDERDKQILQMGFGQEMTQGEIGAQLGISQMHVSRLLTRTLQRLRHGMLTDH